MLEIYKLDRSDKWDEIVKTFNDYDVYYLSGYVKGFYLHGDGEPMLFYYEEDGLKAINVVMKRDIALDNRFKDKIEKNKYFDLSTPYGYGGWLIEGDKELNNLLSEYDNWCRENNIVSEVIRFHPILKNQERLRNHYEIMDLGKTIAIDTSDEETVWANFTTQNRGKIKKAKNFGVEIDHKIDLDTIEEFKKIYEVTMNKDNAEDYYYFDNSFYNSIMNDLKDISDIFYASHEGKMVAATIVLKCNKKLTYHFSGVLTDYRYLQATNLMLYEVGLWGARNGYKTFHLGGGVGSKEDNLYEFKKSFNKKESYQYSIGKRIFNKDLYDKLVSLRKDEELRDNYFPLYRA